MKLIRRNIAQIVALCEKHKVKELCVFGSALTDKFTNYFDFKFALEELLHRDVDLVEYEAIRNPYFKAEVDETKQPIYG